MSSSNEINIIYVPETVYGVTPTGVAFETMRKVSDSLSGTPDTVVSDEARSDRQSGGQSIVGLQVGGAVPFQLSRGVSFDDMIEASMMGTWSATAQEIEEPLAITVSNGVGTLDRLTGDWTTIFSNYEFVELSSAADPENNVVVLLTNVTADIMSFVGPPTMVTNAADSITITRLSHVQIGTTRRSFSMEKQFLDIGKFIAYKGMRAATMKLMAAVKSIVSGEFSFAGASHSTPTVSISDGETVNGASTSPLINPQVDMGFISVDGVIAQYTIQSVAITLNNNISPEEGVGKVGATDQVPFEAAVQIEMTAHLTAASFALIGNKISQVPISFAFALRDPNGDGYAVYVPEAQVSFPDPAMPGKNAHVMLNMSGVARYSSLISNTMRIARIGTIA